VTGRPSPASGDDGFTLVEVLIAIVLVGILSAVAVVGVSTLVGKASNASCRASADASRTAAAVYFTSYASYPPTFAAMTTATGAGPTAVPPSLSLPSGVTVAGAVATSARGGWTLTLTPGSGSSAPTFACSIGTGAVASTLASLWPAVPGGQVGVGFVTTSLGATGGTPPYAWAAPGIPRGLTIGPISGTVYGTPTAPGTFPFTVTITDAVGATVSSAYSIVIAPATVVCPTTSTGWRGEYHGTADLSGPLALCRDDAEIDLEWGWGAPSSALPIDGFSVRWTRTVTVAAGTYTFTMGSDDGSRLSIDGGIVLDRWAVQGYPANPPTVTLVLTGGDHVVVMEYFEQVASARATLSWGPAAPGVIVCSAVPTGWLTEYFANATLSGPPSACRDQASIDVDWGGGAPLAGMPADDFSVRWTRTQTFAAGPYTFTMGSDDGSRLLVDGVVILDRWTDHGYPTAVPSVTATLTQGPHTVVMELYEHTGGARATLAVTPAP
jgi:prepilin-type N-terminal cleavage/methylation domain-containing protein